MRRDAMPVGQAGFTLVEVVMVIVITGILAGIVAVFIGGPIRGYVDTARRAELTDIADTTLRRVGRDLRRALPNSVRVSNSGGVFYLEYLEVRSGGRYRMDTSGAPTSPACPADDAGLADNDILEPGYADTCFKTLGNISDSGQVTTSDFVAVYNLGPGFGGADAYQSGAASGGNKSKITAVSSVAGEDRIAFESNNFNLASPGGRFQIVSGPVSYVCDPLAGTLTRYRGYAIQAAQPVNAAAPPLSTANSALLATAVSGCSIAYAPGVTERSGLVAMNLKLTREGESVSLYHEVHVSNVP